MSSLIYLVTENLFIRVRRLSRQSVEFSQAIVFIIYLWADRQNRRDAGSNLQAFNNPAIDQMLFDDLVNIFPIDIGIPDSLGVHDDHRSLLTTVETSRRIDPHSALAGESKRLGSLLGIIAHGLRIKALATCAAISTFIGTEKYVISIIGHPRKDTAWARSCIVRTTSRESW